VQRGAARAVSFDAGEELGLAHRRPLLGLVHHLGRRPRSRDLGRRPITDLLLNQPIRQDDYSAKQEQDDHLFLPYDSGIWGCWKVTGAIWPQNRD
jgi:hypothetical protein